jgi:hypothetical protein
LTLPCFSASQKGNSYPHAKITTQPIMTLPPFRLTQNQRRIAATFMLVCFLPTAALALPTIPQVASGNANISTTGNAMTISNSANAIINPKNGGRLCFSRLSVAISV